MTRTPEQQIAELEARIARLRQKSRTLETGQKIILGGALLAEARKHPLIRQTLFDLAASVTREVDKARLAPLLQELSDLPA